MQEQARAPDFFVSFHSASCLSLGDLVQRCRPASRLASAMTFSGCDTSPTVDCCSFSICRTQSPEAWRTFAWTNWLSCGDNDFFFLVLTRRRRGLGGRGDKILRWRQCLHPLRCMQKRDSVSVPRDTQKCEQEDWAAVSGSERIAPYRQDQSRLEAYTTGFSQTSNRKRGSASYIVREVLSVRER